MVTGNAEPGFTAIDGTFISKYHIKITYYPVSGETFNVTSIGVWLPPGCSYKSDASHKSDFENTAWPSNCQATPVPFTYKGSQAVVWTFNPSNKPAFTDFPNVVVGSPVSMDATFYFAPPQTNITMQPQAVGWIVPSGTITTGTPAITVCWDADIRIFKLHSVSGGSTVDSYVAKAELRTLQSAMNGDYVATGNDLMEASPKGSSNNRSVKLNSSDATITTIPTDAQVTGAFLYWSAWRQDSNIVNIFTKDQGGANFSNKWTADTNPAWSVAGSSDLYYQGHSNIGMNLTLKNGVNIASTYEQGSALISWSQWATVPASSATTSVVPAADGASTGTWNLAQVRIPSGDGTVNGTWTPATRWNAVDEAPILGIATDSNYKTCTAAGTALNIFSPFNIPSTATNINVVVYTFAQKNGNNTCTAYATLKVGGTTYNNGTAFTPALANGTDGWKASTWGNNPKTSAAWTPDQINGIDATNPLQQFGSAATVVTSNLKVNAEYIEVYYTDINKNFQNIDETSSTADMSSVMASPVAAGGGKQLFISSVSIPDDAMSIVLKVHYRACDADPSTSGSGTNDIRAGLQIGGTLYNSGSTNPPLTSLTSDTIVTFNTNPATTKSWTIADINGVGAYPLQQFGVYSGDLSPNVAVSLVWVEITYTAPIGPSDGLDIALYNPATGLWSSNINVFLGGNIDYAKPTQNNYTYAIPSLYFQNGFKFRFTLRGFNAANVYLNLDDIQIRYMQPDVGVTFKINDQQVSFNGTTGNPQIGGPLISTRNQVLPNYDGSGNSWGFSYSCYRDVTSLVQQYAATHAPATNRSGNDKYTLGGDPITASILSDTGDNWSYAGWSIIIVYTSPATLGHQLYLYDTFEYGAMNSDIRFGDMSAPYGGNISGFIVPAQVNGAVTTITLGIAGNNYTTAPAVNFNGGGGSGAAAIATVSGGHIATLTMINGGSGYTSVPTISFTGGGGSGATASVTIGNELNVGKITCAVGEGDGQYTGDFVAFNASQTYWGSFSSVPTDIYTNQFSAVLNDGVTPTNNAWNSSPLDGIDIKTFPITWASGLMHQGDTNAHIDLPTGTDSWDLMYIIISFRSVTTTGGSLSYLIH
jgi:hypothetical protein